MHVVCVVAFDGVVPFDLATPCEVLGRTVSASGSPAYRVEVCGVSRDVDAGFFRMRPRFGLARLARAHTIVVPGLADPSRPVSPRLLRALRAAKARGARIASICTGAFVLAAAGILDGQRATTHWLAAPELAARYPRVRVDASVLYVDGGQVLTSAGAAAGLDLCLHLVRRDHGAEVAASAARVAVMPLERAGGQAQFIAYPAPVDEGGSFEPLLRWMEERAGSPLSLEALARRAGTSVRTFSRHFRAQTGTTPLQWLLQARIRRAQRLLESTAWSIDTIAARAGFGSAGALRLHFRRIVGAPANAYRRSFRRP